MGLFDIFKKKEEPKPQNNPNSVFTLRFTVPYFQIFDKTNPKLKSLPVSMAVTGSCQYRISEPDLCFDNVRLGEMSPEHLEAHVKDALSMNIKSYFNSISDIPLLQFEQRIAAISDGCKKRLTQQFSEEYGINLRTFHISGVRYDIEHPNYVSLQKISQIELTNQAKFAEASGDADIERLKEETSADKARIKAKGEMDAARIKHDFEIEKKRKDSNLDADFGINKDTSPDFTLDTPDLDSFDTK